MEARSNIVAKIGGVYAIELNGASKLAHAFIGAVGQRESRGRAYRSEAGSVLLFRATL